MRMCHFVNCDLPRSTIFFHIIKWTARFSKKLMNIKCVFLVSLRILSEIFSILRRTERDVVIYIYIYTYIYIYIYIYIGRHVKCPLFLSDFNETWIFSTDFRKIVKYQIPWKHAQWQPRCSMRTDGRTDRHDEANSRLSQFFERA
jgi:hypothetical protein